MAQIVTHAECKAIIAECLTNGTLTQYQEGPEVFWQVPSPLGSGYGRGILLRPGLVLEVLSYRLSRIHRHSFQHGRPLPLTLIFYLEGGSHVDNAGLEAPQQEVAGHSYLHCLPGTAETEEYPTGQHIHVVRIRISPELMPLLSDLLDELPADLRHAIQYPQEALLYRPSRIPPAQHQILQQILQWPYQGITRQLYLEGKVLELLALYFNQMLTPAAAPNQSLAAADIDRIYQARDLLIQNMASPPSLPELAKRVHLNERKLKQGFQQLFHATVFGYLQDQRLEQARKLLQTGQLNIQETARWVGYASRSSFVAAFKKKFQAAPSNYLKAASQAMINGQQKQA